MISTVNILTADEKLPAYKCLRYKDVFLKIDLWKKRELWLLSQIALEVQYVFNEDK